MRETGGARRSPVGRRRGHEHRAQGKGRAGVFRPVDVVPCRVVRDGRLLLHLRLRDGVRDGTGERRKTRGMGASRRMRSSARVRVRVLARVPVRMLSLRLPRGAREDSTYRGPALAVSIHTRACVRMTMGQACPKGRTERVGWSCCSPVIPPFRVLLDRVARDAATAVRGR